MVTSRLAIFRLLIVIVLASELPAADLAFDAMVRTLLRHNVPEIHTADLKKSPASVLLDARSRREYEVSHMTSAIWIGYDEFSLERLQGIRKNTRIVVYCSVGYRSEKITALLIQNGYRQSKNYVGGIFDWINDGGKVVSSTGIITDAIHGYNRSWGIWLKKGRVIYD